MMWTKIGKVILVSLLSLVMGFPLCAGVQVSSTVDKKEVCAGSSFVYTITISGDVTNYSLPEKISIPGARVYGRGSSQQITVRNGRVTNVVRLNFVVMPIKTGEIKIPSLKIKINGRNYFTPEQSVSVKDCGVSKQPPIGSQSYGGNVPYQGQNLEPEGQDDTFAVISLDKDKVYLGEPLVLTYTIYTRSRVAYKGFSKQPFFEGFVQEEAPPGEDMNRREVVIGGRRYVAVDVMRFVLVPTQTGKLMINPGSLLMAKASRMRDVFKDFFSDSFWDSFFNDDFFATEERFDLSISPRDVQVLPLPKEGCPKDFSGLVGDFSLNVKVDKDKVKVGQGITLTIEVKGSGPLSVLDSIPIEVDNARVYKSSSSSSMELVNGKPIYKKTFEYILLPDESGKLQIPKIKINFFSPTEKTYKEIEYPGKEIEVLPGKQDNSDAGFYPAGEQDVPSNTGSGIKKVGEDIRFIKEKFTVENDNYWHWFWASNLIIALLVLLFVFREKIMAIGMGVHIKSREKAEVERLISAYQANPDDETLRQILSKVLKLAAKKMPDKADSFRHLSENFPELTDVSSLVDAFLFGNLPVSEEDKMKILNTIKKVLKNLILLVCIVFFSYSSYVWAQDTPEVGFRTGNSLYQAGDYHGAIKEYEKLISKGVKSFELFYNLGNAYYKAGVPERALLYYLKAFKINPLDDDLKYNIDLVQRKLGVGESSQFLNGRFLFPPKMLSGIIAVVFWLMVIFSMANITPVRKFTVVSLGTVTLIILAIWLIFSVGYLNGDTYLVMKKSILYSGPSEKDNRLVVLNPGVEVKAVKRLGDWIQVKAGNGVLGWVKKSSVERI